MEAKVVFAPAGPGDLEALLPLLERFNASQGYAFDPAVARPALGELLARPELGRAFRIVSGGASVGYAVLTFGWSLEWAGATPSWTRSSSRRQRAAGASGALRSAR